uniref:Dicer-like protein n=1 Tax=Paramecium caudatum TaxID=5885 RepID=W1I8X7_PARCA|nr:Dicer-like protein [Paramecium caudatum]
MKQMSIDWKNSTLNDSYRIVKDQVIAFQNIFQLSKEQEIHDLKILSPQQLKSSKQVKFFNWNVNFQKCQLQLYTKEEFHEIYQYNCFLLGDCYKANSLSYIQQKYRTFESYFDTENRNNLLLLGENIRDFNQFKLKNTLQNPFSDMKKMYVNKRNPFVTFAVYDIIQSNEPAINFFTKLLLQSAFGNLEEAFQYYGITQNQVMGMNVHELFQSQLLIPGNMVAYRQNFPEYYDQIAFCSYTLHINQFHRNVPNMEFSTNICEQCNSPDPNQACTCLKSASPLKQPQLIPLSLLQEYPMNYKYYDIICSLYHSFICQFKIWSYQDSIERIINCEINPETIVTSQSNINNNYENLELLGDAVLKYVVTVELFNNYELLDEGEMTSLRSRIIMNTFLASLFQQLGLQNYIINQDLHFKQIRNPLVNELKSSEDPELQMSQMADIYEALIGGVFEQSQSLYEFISILRKTNFPISCKRDKLYDYEPLEQKVLSLDFKEYQFNNSQLLQVALNTQTYDRLEFLGDAAFELLIIAYLFKIARNKQRKDPHWKLNPGLLSSWKQSLLSNKFMGELVIKLGLMPQIEDIPKMYGDIFESVGAAVLLDGGWAAFNQVFGSLYKPYIEQLIE